MSAPACRLCGSPRTTPVGVRRGEFIHRDFTFHDCAACAFRFVTPFAGYEIYDDAYYRGEGPDPYVSYELEYRDWRATDRALEFADLARLAEDFFRPAAPSSAPLAWLDFGCGAGGLLKFLRDRGTLADRPLALAGHDVGSYADQLRTRDAFRILDLAAVRAEPAASYDVISLIEVIEHLEHPAEVVALAARLLRPGGLLLLTTGNLRGPLPRLRGLRYAYCLPEIHVSLFNPRTLGLLYARHGLAPLRMRYDGVVRFKVLKTIRSPALRRVARAALHFPPILRVIDWLYGTSAMPCATKPAA